MGPVPDKFWPRMEYRAFELLLFLMLGVAWIIYQYDKIRGKEEYVPKEKQDFAVKAKYSSLDEYMKSDQVQPMTKPTGITMTMKRSYKDLDANTP